LNKGRFTGQRCKVRNAFNTFKNIANLHILEIVALYGLFVV